MLPSSPTATQNEAEAHEIPRSSSGWGSCAVDHAAASPVGFVEVTILPLPAAAAQNEAVGQETPNMCVLGPFPSRSTVFQADAPPFGFVEE